MYSTHFSLGELNKAETIALNAAREVAPTLLENFGKSAHSIKSDERDWVTEWDMWANEQIIERLGKFSTEVGILSEETGATGSQEVYWTVDAIDGTSGFVRGIDNCTTMISLVDLGKPVISVIHDFMRGVPYTAVASGGAFVNEVQRLQVSQRTISTAYIEAYLGKPVEAKVRSRLQAAGAFLLQTGAAGHMFTGIARGATEGFVSLQNPFGTIWDYAPGALLVREAGGVVMNVGSHTYDVNNHDIIASNRFTFNNLRSAAAGGLLFDE